ncbi:MAG TPA: hypothetical protein VLG67_04780 [Candidatus Saccharimonadales bacterium]|nr:hypothetical protein [Candidatus Saccharimonadales bacterium]
MENNQQQSRFKIIIQQIWPYINKILNYIFYFILGLIKTFFRYAKQMIKGE